MKKAFTLIELLVVIAAIAVLMGILMPALRSARDSARRAVCSAHMHDLGLAILHGTHVKMAMCRS